jgi:hypothetical protein
MPLRIEHYDPRERDQDSDYDDDNDSYYSEPRHESSSTDSDYETDDDFFDDEGNFRPRQHVFEERPLQPLTNLDDIEIVNGQAVFKTPILDISLQPVCSFYFPTFIDYADIQSGKYFADLEKQKELSIEEENNQQEKENQPSTLATPSTWKVTSALNNTQVDLSVIQKQEEEEEKNKEERRRRPPPPQRPPPSPQNFRSKGPPRSLLRPHSNPTPSPRHMNHREERPKTRLLSNPQSARSVPPSPVLTQTSAPTPRAQPQPSPTPSVHKKTNRKIDMLCAYRSGHDSQCRLTHDLDSWRPRTCKFKESCNKIKHCSFWHSERETKKEYIQRSFSLRDSHFAKLSKEYKELYL